MAPHQVARAVETVRSELACVVVGHPVIAAQCVGTAHSQLPDLAIGNLAALLVCEPHLVVSADRPADGLQPHVLRVIAPYEK